MAGATVWDHTVPEGRIARAPRYPMDLNAIPRGEDDQRARLLRLAGEVQNGGVEGLFAVDEGAERLPQGRFVRFDLALPAQSDLLALPYEAIYGGDRVYRVDDQSRLRPVFVERVGEVRDGEHTRVLVRSTTLVPGDRVILTQLPNAVDGLLVQIAPSSGNG